jgi:hypothetical protein
LRQFHPAHADRAALQNASLVPLAALLPARLPRPFRAVLKPDRSRATKSGQITSQPHIALHNEGWNVYNAQRPIDHELICDSNYWRRNNYPIFSFLLAVGVNSIIHNLLISGRVIALASFVAIGILAAAAIRRLGGDRVDAVFGGGRFFAGFEGTSYNMFRDAAVFLAIAAGSCSMSCVSGQPLQPWRLPAQPSSR